VKTEQELLDALTRVRAQIARAESIKEQQYSVGGRQVTQFSAAMLQALYDRERELEAQLDRVRRGGIRVRYGVIRLLLYAFLCVPSLALAQQVPKLTLTWTDNADNEDGFKIERRLGQTGSFTQIGQVGKDVVTYADTQILVNTEYCYRVRAFNAGGQSAYSNIACGLVPSAPAAPSGLGIKVEISATATDASRIVVAPQIRVFK
jgi:hypothetical protein